METENNIVKKGRSRQEKEQLVALWKQSGKSRKEFCIEQGLNYNTFVTWPYELEGKRPSGFKEVKFENPDNSLFAQIYFPNGVRVDLLKPTSLDFLKTLK